MQSHTTQNSNPYQHKILTIPNLLSFFRLVLIPPIVWLYTVQNQYTWTVALLILSALTDVVDGWIARWYHMVSDFGKIIDPIADKLTLISMLACLVKRFPQLLIPLIALVVKELINGVFGLYTNHRAGYTPCSEWHGKLSTALLYSTIVLHLVVPDISVAMTSILSFLCTGIILISALRYFRRSLHMLCRQNSHISKGEHVNA